MPYFGNSGGDPFEGGGFRRWCRLSSSAAAILIASGDGCRKGFSGSGVVLGFGAVCISPPNVFRIHSGLSDCGMNHIRNQGTLPDLDTKAPPPMEPNPLGGLG